MVISRAPFSRSAGPITYVCTRRLQVTSRVNFSLDLPGKTVNAKSLLARSGPRQMRQKLPEAKWTNRENLASKGKYNSKIANKFNLLYEVLKFSQLVWLHVFLIFDVAVSLNMLVNTRRYRTVSREPYVGLWYLRCGTEKYVGWAFFYRS